ncbi:MAG: hypothetical protein A2086_12430 [Spirochaetes bacterium GWD1_27_9]|nr:MAG: hypothetical protein A2Z98_04845 [Spirochaetes bacterium GWB1_27_13]OHD23053.1 MAG: hypothetical protein A2Y34_17890 [Spirochaetes bacterium GWC1_27_15]OHD34430.1 MAG: hypothetical protein A2086_12430 [Spirochaetes bacterium GWD1_27_9]
MIIDFHTHTFPDNIAQKAIDDLKKLSDFSVYADGRESSLIENLKKGEVDYAVVLPVSTKASQVESINRYNVEKNIPNIFFIGAMHPDFPDFEKELSFLSSNGIKGIKLHPEFQDFKPDDKKYYPMYEALISFDMFVLFHSGKEEFLKRLVPNGHPKNFYALQKQFPTLKIVVAHCGGHAMYDEMEEFLLGKNIYFDLSYELPFVDEQKILKLFNKHSKDLILYGSDYPWQPLQEYHNYFNKFKLSLSDKEKIEYKNALELLGKK